VNNTNDFRSIPAENRLLIHKSFDQPLTEVEVARLEQVLKSDQVARRLYCELALLGADLFARNQAMAVFRDTQLELGNDEAASPASRVPWGQGALEFVLSIPRAAAAVLAFGLGLGCGVGILAAVIVHRPSPFRSPKWEWKVPDDVVAKIESTYQAATQVSESPETPPTRGLREGQEIRLDSGLVQIVYRDGVEVILEGPAVYMIRSAQSGKLFSGKLTAVVPADCTAFQVETPIGKVDVGPGRFGIAADNSAIKREVSVLVITGQARGMASANFASNSGRSFELREGESVRISSDGEMSKGRLLEPEEFPSHMPLPHREPYIGDKIYLGNLFDDSQTASLTEAMLSDQFQAAAETIDLGVAAVLDGGLDVDVRLADEGVFFNFANVGGGGARILGLPSNDTYRSSLGIPIRTTGVDLPFQLIGDHILQEPTTKIEEGIGIHSNELLTFDLNELRSAGLLGDRPMRFVADRAGINDREHPLRTSREFALANLVVVVSKEDQVISAYLNGEPADVVQHANVYSLNVDKARASRGLRYDGQFVKFDVPIPAEARFLTLVSADLGNTLHDHTVFSGARLELEPANKGVRSH
jgi:hypothetical protein